MWTNTPTSLLTEFFPNNEVLAHRCTFCAVRALAAVWITRWGLREGFLCGAHFAVCHTACGWTFRWDRGLGGITKTQFKKSPFLWSRTELVTGSKAPSSCANLLCLGGRIRKTALWLFFPSHYPVLWLTFWADTDTKNWINGENTHACNLQPFFFIRDYIF